MTKKPTTASVGDGNIELAKQGLKDRQKTGMIDADDTVLSISDHGDIIAVYTQSASFNVKKPPFGAKNGGTGKTG